MIEQNFAQKEERLRGEIERGIHSAARIDVIYFGGSLPGSLRKITPLRYSEERGKDYLIAFCHQSRMEKTFKLERMNLPEPPMEGGKNDYITISKFLLNPQLLDGMLSQIAALGNLPIERALAAHHSAHGEFESFFKEYSYGGYILSLRLSDSLISLHFGYEAADAEGMNYRFTVESSPQLTPEIADHYRLIVGW
ncbi:MAG: hypothetical protein QM627_02395 [Luteolibacter sp.]